MHECVPGSRLWSRGLDGTKSNSSQRLISILAYFCLRAPRDNLTMERNEARSALRYLGGIAIVDNCMSLLAPVPPWVLQGMTINMRRLIKRLRLTALLMLLIATASGCNLERITPTPLPTPDRPRVEILRPAAEQQVVEGATFDIDILAVDYSQGIQRVELYVDGFLLNASEPPELQSEYLVTMNWFANGLGWHSFTALAYRADGASSAEHEIRLQVIARS